MGIGHDRGERNAELLEPPRDVAQRGRRSIADGGQRLALDHCPSGAGAGENGAREENQKRGGAPAAILQNSGFDFHSASLTSASYSSADIDRFA